MPLEKCSIEVWFSVAILTGVSQWAWSHIHQRSLFRRSPALGWRRGRGLEGSAAWRGWPPPLGPAPHTRSPAGGEHMEVTAFSVDSQIQLYNCRQLNSTGSYFKSTLDQPVWKRMRRQVLCVLLERPVTDAFVRCLWLTVMYMVKYVTFVKKRNTQPRDLMFLWFLDQLFWCVCTSVLWVCERQPGELREMTFRSTCWALAKTWDTSTWKEENDIQKRHPNYTWTFTAIFWNSCAEHFSTHKTTY